MKHFSREQWQAFYRGQIEEDALLESHLLVCDACRQVFLDCIEDADLEQAEDAINPDFTARTLGYIRENGQQGRQNQYRLQSRRLLAFYTAAAALTIMLTGGGVLQSLNNRIINPPLSSAVKASSNYEEKIFNWPAQLREKTSSWINHIEFKQLKEVQQ
ncbi:MAG: hypothetical protein ABFD08_15635 [Syntrophomonas sp.]